METAIAVKGVSKSFGKKKVLQDIDICVQKGQVYGLIGPSGSGKTTLIKVIVGMDRPTAGKVEVLGSAVPDLQLLQKMGYMAQSDALYPELTGQENLAFFAALFKMNRAERKERIAYAAGLVALNADLGKKVAAYSGGMKRRLSLAIALIQNPEILILDEPTVGIDPELRVAIWQELMRLRREEGKTIVVTTHVMDEAEKCDCLAMVRDGRILTSGSPQELKLQYGASHLEEVFLVAGGKQHAGYSSH